MKMLEGHKVDNPLTLKILKAWQAGFFEEHKKYSDKILREKGIIIPK